MKHKIGVIGSAKGKMNEELVSKARDIGREIARHDCFLLTGAGMGLPYEAVLGAKEVGGFTVGFSPASNKVEHIERYKFPVENFDIIVYTGFDYRGRIIPFIKSSDAIIGISGGKGTLSEYSTALAEDKITGVLIGSGGISDIIKEIENACENKKGGIFYNTDPKTLVKEVVESLNK